MEEGNTARSRRRSRGSNSSHADMDQNFVPRTSRRLAGQRPEVEVIRRSRHSTDPQFHSNSAQPTSIPYTEHVTSRNEEYWEKEEHGTVPKDHDILTTFSAPTTAVGGIISPIIVDDMFPMDDDVEICDLDDTPSILSGENLQYDPSPYFATIFPDVASTETSSMAIDVVSASTPTLASSPPLSLNSSPTTSTEYWDHLIAKHGLKRLHLTMDAQGDLSATPDSTPLSGVYSPADSSKGRKNGSSNGSSSSSSHSKKKRSTTKKIAVVEEEIVFTEQDLVDKQIRERSNELEALQHLENTMSSLSELMKDSSTSPFPMAVSRAISDLLDEVIVEVVQDAHICLLFRPDEAVLTLNGRSGLDVFGQDPSSIRADSFLCGNSCGRIISSNRYAPHLEKCTGLQGAKWKPSRRSAQD